MQKFNHRLLQALLPLVGVALFPTWRWLGGSTFLPPERGIELQVYMFLSAAGAYFGVCFAFCLPTKKKGASDG